MPKFTHQWNDELGRPALSIDSFGVVYLGDSNMASFTPQGGLAVRFVNKTGAPSVRGTLVTTGSADGCVVTVQAGIPNAAGIVYDSGVPDGGWIRVVVSGIAEVLFADGQGPTAGYWVGTSDAVNGRAMTQQLPPGVGLPSESAAHNGEIGHCIDTRASGTNVTARVLLHFN